MTMEAENIQNSPEITNLTAEELNLIDIIIKNPFASNVKLSEITGIDRHVLAKIKNRPHVQEKIKDFVISNIERFQEIQTDALNVAAELLKSDKEMIRWQAAKPFVEGLKTTKIEVESEGNQVPVFNLVPVKPQ